MGIANKLINEIYNSWKEHISVEVTTGSIIKARSLYEKFSFQLAKEDDEKVQYVYYFK